MIQDRYWRPDVQKDGVTFVGGGAQVLTADPTFEDGADDQCASVGQADVDLIFAPLKEDDVTSFNWLSAKLQAGRKTSALRDRPAA